MLSLRYQHRAAADVLDHPFGEPPEDRGDDDRPGSVTRDVVERGLRVGNAVALRVLEREHRRELEPLLPHHRCQLACFPARRPHVAAIERKRDERETRKADARRHEVELEPVHEFRHRVAAHADSKAENV